MSKVKIISPNGSQHYLDGSVVVGGSSVLAGKEDVANKVTSLSAQSTDVQYPSAKCVYDITSEQVVGDGIKTVKKISQDDYEALTEYDDETLYVII